jgi:UDPglucose--hexose-1-phosphate uridylyltransferase
MTMPLMTVDEVLLVVDCWMTETRLLSQKFRWVQLFENRGELMGQLFDLSQCVIPPLS